jgi:hypothetical protein
VKNARRCSSIVLGFAVLAVLLGSSAVPALAKANVVPFEFVGAAGDCGDGYPAGAKIVTGAWVQGLGLPDNGDDNFNSQDPSDVPAKNDRHEGLLLNKNGASPVCSAAGATVTGIKRIAVSTSTELGYDFRNGTHCGAGAPRFNVVARLGGTDSFHFIGACANGAQTPAPQDPAQWTRVRFNVTNPGQAFPVIPDGAEIRSITIIYDEGTDTPTAPDNPGGVGLAVIDNIFIDGEIVSRGPKK